MVDRPLFGIAPEDTISAGYYFFTVCLCALTHTRRLADLAAGRRRWSPRYLRLAGVLRFPLR